MTELWRVWFGEFIPASTTCFRRQLGTQPQAHSTGGSHRQQVIPGSSCPAHGAFLPPHAWQSHTALSQLQLLQVPPAGANFHFNIQFHREFDGVFHLMFHDLSNLGGNIRHQTRSQLQCSGFLSIAGADRHLESYPTFICTDLPLMGMQPNPV